MKKLFSLVAILLFAFACGPLPQEQEAESAVGITAPDGFSISCVSGYTRILPHFCAKDSVTTSVSLINDNSCHTLVLDVSIPLSAKFVEVVVNFSMASGNLVAQRVVNPVFYLENTCSTNNQQWFFTVREEVAVSSVNLWSTTLTARLKVKNGSEIYYISDDGSSTATITLLPTGYYD